MNREAINPSSEVVALVVSGPDEVWLLPDDPFLNLGCKLVRARNLAEVQNLCHHYEPHLVFLPLAIAGEPSMAALRHCLGRKLAPVVVVVAANDQINAAAEAMRAGAYDCLFKPFSRARLSKTIESALKTVVRPPNPVSAVAPAPGSGPEAAPKMASAESEIIAPGGIIAGSREMRTPLTRVAVLAQKDVPVFISGEVGTGKSMLARLIHDRSLRADAAFVTLDGATLTATQLDTELFGPTGAAMRAQGGTLYIDQACELDLAVQPRLLRFVETGIIDGTSHRANVRFIASTRGDPRAALKDGRLRADLYYRLHVAPIDLPPLAARGGDAQLIARTKLKEYSRAEGRVFTGFSEAALDLIGKYNWPGNVRELLNVVWTLVLMNEGPLITPSHLPYELQPPHLVPSTAPETDTDAPTEQSPQPDPGNLVGRTLAEIERDVIEATIQAEGGSVPRAARVLDVSPSTIYRKRESWTKTPSA